MPFGNVLAVIECPSSNPFPQT